jgi:hypothetical protein
MEHSQLYKVELALRKSIANDLFIKRDIFKTKEDLDKAIRIVEKRD